MTLLGLADLVERGAQALQVSLGDGVLMEGGSCQEIVDGVDWVDSDSRLSPDCVSHQEDKLKFYKERKRQICNKKLFEVSIQTVISSPILAMKLISLAHATDKEAEKQS